MHETSRAKNKKNETTLNLLQGLFINGKYEMTNRTRITYEQSIAGQQSGWEKTKQ